MKTMKIKPSHESQGDHVVINEEDFDPALHEAIDSDKREDFPQKASIGDLRDALTAKGIEIPDGAKKADLQALLDANP